MKSIANMMLILLIFSTACSRREEKNDERTPVLEVEGRFLYLDELKAVIPTNISAADSTLIADGYIKKWVTDVLMYEKAKRNISNSQDIENEVEDYRKTLILHQYQQDILKEQLNTNLSDEQLQNFYDKYTDEFVLNEPLIKGLYIKVPLAAPKKGNLREWIRTYTNTNSLQNLEKYCVLNATTYDYFGDRWVSFNEVAKNIPFTENESSLLGGSRLLEVQDSTFHYFLRISDYRPEGSTEPFDEAKEKIKMSLITKLGIDFIKKYEEDLYNNAVKEGDINFFKK